VQPLAIEVNDVWFSYDGQLVLREVNLRIEQGEFLAILGPNGSGKTTLLKLMLGILKPTRGTIRVLGQEPSAAPDRIGYVPQDTNVNKDFPVSVMDVALMGRLGQPGRSRRYAAEDRGLAKEALQKVNMWEYRHRPIGKLSGGEPLGGLDAVTRNRMIDLLLALRKKHGFTQICVEHDLSAAARLADRFWVLPGPGAPAEAIDFRPRGRGASGLPPPLEERVLLVESRLAAVAEKWDEPVQGRMSR